MKNWIEQNQALPWFGSTARTLLYMSNMTILQLNAQITYCEKNCILKDSSTIITNVYRLFILKFLA